MATALANSMADEAEDTDTIQRAEFGGVGWQSITVGGQHAGRVRVAGLSLTITATPTLRRGRRRKSSKEK